MPSTKHDAWRTGLRVLYVEDDPDVQEMLRALLEEHGYEVTTAATADAGLAALEKERFHLVIADYNLPDGDGASMLSRAAALGRLDCESLILTGAYQLGSHATAFRVMRKPIDATTFLAKLDDLLAPIREAELEEARTSVRSRSNEPEARIDLVLYVSEASRASLRAVRRLRALVEQFGPERICLRIVDVSRERPPSFDDDRITFTPTLVKVRPGPRTYFLGALDRTDDLVGVLEDTSKPNGEGTT